MRTHKALRLGLALLAPVILLAAFHGCTPEDTFIWICLNPKTGHEDARIYDTTNYANGQPDPCHCYDKCGPQKSCPIDVDAGPPPPGCPVDGGADGGP